MLALLVAARLVNRYGSRIIAFLSLLLYSVLLACLGFAGNVFSLVVLLVLFGIAGNVANIAINTQSVAVEARYGRPIMASFHGLWSLAGFTAAGIATLLLGRGVPTAAHFTGIGSLVAVAAVLTYPKLVRDNRQTSGQRKRFTLPDATLLRLGALAFCCLICEGAMFDWSGVYFQKIVHAERAWVGAGYTAFMSTMAGGRFVADWLTARAGFTRTLRISGLLIASGLALAVAFPTVPVSIAGFLLVGFGVSSVVPLVYSRAGRSTTVSPGSAIAIVTSIGFMGFLVGPPLVGLLAGLFSLRVSIAVVALVGVVIASVAGLVDRKAGQK
ncbi:MAG: transporter [Flaviaesturariibacter sp.]|nr:transporter [Flaviaesturariibacter sp.]